MEPIGQSYPQTRFIRGVDYFSPHLILIEGGVHVFRRDGSSEESGDTSAKVLTIIFTR